MSWSVPERSAAVAIALLMLLAVVPMSGAASQTSLPHAGGGVAFTFSAGWASGTAAAAILESHNMRGTFYVSSGLLRQGSYFTAYMSASDLANLSARGHDIESMTVTQRDLTTLGSAELVAELANSQAALQTITGKLVRHLAYPYGAVNDAVASAAAARYLSGRTISWSIDDFAPSVDSYRLPGFIMRQSTTLTEAKWIVDQAISRNVYVVLSFGNIVSNPGAYDWTPADLDALAAYVQSKGVTASTISQVVTGAPPPTLPPPPVGTGTIVLTFDDGSTTHIGAGQTLAARGFRGTFYIVSECSKSEANRAYCMSSQQVKSLSDAGHDIESHTERHRDLTSVKSGTLTSELRDSQATLSSLTGKPVRHVAYPYGSHDLTVRTRADDYYTTGRIFLKNPAPADLPQLLAQSGTDRMVVAGIGVTAATSLDRAKAYIDYAVSVNATLVLSFHDLTSPPIDEFAWSPANFAALMDYIKTKGPTVKTMAQAYR